MNPSKIVQVSATGDVSASGVSLRAVTLTAGSDAATLTVRSGGSGGTVVLTVKAAANTTAAVPELHDAWCGGAIHATLAGTGPVASFVYV